MVFEDAKKESESMKKKDTQRCRTAEPGAAESKHRQEGELQRRAALMALTYDVVHRVSNKVDLDELFSEVVTAVRDAFDYYGVMLLLVDERAKCLTLQAVKGDFAHIVPENHQVAIGEGMIGSAGASGETEFSGDVSQEPRYLRVASEATKSELAVPIKDGEKIIGVLDIQSDQFDVFDEADVMVMETLSAHIAIAIENAQLHEVVQQELSKRRRGEEEIRQLRQRLESVIDNATIWLNVLDKDGKVVFWNKTAETISGYSYEEMVHQGKDWVRLLYPEEAYRKEVLEKTVALREGGEATEEFESTIRCKDGQTKIILWNLRNLLDESGNLIGSIAIVRDITERKRTEEALRASEERFALAVEGSNAGIWDWDIHGNTLYWSPRMKEILGYAPDEIEASFEVFEAHLCPEDKESTEIAIEAHLQERVPYDVEQRMLTKTGEYRWYRARGQALWDERGRPLRMVGSTADITELKQAEERLEKERNLLRTIIDNVPDLIYAKNTESRYFVSNTAHVRFLGATTPNEVVGKSSFEFYPQELAEQNYADDKEVIHSGQPLINREVRVVDQTGNNVWNLTTKVPLRDSHGKIVGLVGIARDITALKSAEEEIRRLNQFQESVIDNASVWINVLDEKANVVLWNKAAETISGYTRGETVGHDKIWEWLYPDDIYRRELTGRVAATLAKGKGDDVLETTIRCKDGRARIISWNQTNLLNEGGKLTGSIVIGLDITDRRKAEEQVQRYISEIEVANEEVKQFAYIVSHDLRAPLVNLKGFAVELRSSLEDVSPVIEAALPTVDEERRKDIDVAFREDIPEALGFIESSVTRMDSFLNAVLKLSRLGRRELSLKAIDMNAIVEAARQSLAHQIEERHVDLTVSDLPEVVADRTSMEQVIGNLFTNALLYLDPNRPGAIEIGGKREELATTFWVRDSGRGISEDDAPKVFAPFRRAGKQDVPGEGMGLSYVKTIVRMHGGQIWFKSEPDVGTTFFFTIAKDLAKGETDGGQTRG